MYVVQSNELHHVKELSPVSGMIVADEIYHRLGSWGIKGKNVYTVLMSTAELILTCGV